MAKKKQAAVAKSKGQQKSNKGKCSLFPYERQDVLTIQEAEQHAGWHITAFNLEDDWKSTRGDGVKVAVIDTGCQMDHFDLVGNLLPGINFVEPGSPPEDNCGHGCHTTGIICAMDNDKGIVGVAPLAKVIPVKVLDANGNGSMENVAAGIRWAVDNGADIISMSLGAPNPLQQVCKAIQYAESKGVPIFCAAGNSGNTENVFYPARYAETIAIGSIDEGMDRAAYSNTGENLDFMAPGTRIMSTVPKHWYALMTGSSMACPWVAGIAALYLAHCRKRHPDRIPKCSDDYRQAFRAFTIPVNDVLMKDKKFYQGFGILDPRRMHDELFD
jgi:subtilisin family serine protease